MTTLLQRCQSVTAKVEQLTLAQRHANQQRLVQERTREWKSCSDKLKAVKVRVACLSLDAEAQRKVAEKRAHLRHNAAQVIERLKSDDDIAQLTEDASWTRLLASVESLSSELETFGRSAWRSYIEDQRGRSGSCNRAPSTPMNDAAIALPKALRHVCRPR